MTLGDLEALISHYLPNNGLITQIGVVQKVVILKVLIEQTLVYIFYILCITALIYEVAGQNFDNLDLLSAHSPRNYRLIIVRLNKGGPPLVQNEVVERF